MKKQCIERKPRPNKIGNGFTRRLYEGLKQLESSSSSSHSGSLGVPAGPLYGRDEFGRYHYELI